MDAIRNAFLAHVTFGEELFFDWNTGVTHANSRGTSHPDKKRLRKYLVPFNNERHAAENATKKELRDRFALLFPKSESASGNASSRRQQESWRQSKFPSGLL
jgi:hypothetical protein